MKKVHITGALSEGWKQFMLRPWYLMGITLVALTIGTVVSPNDTTTALAFIVYGGYLALMLKHSSGERVVFDDLFDLVDKRWIYFGFLGVIKFLVVASLIILPALFLFVSVSPDPEELFSPDMYWLLMVPIEVLGALAIVSFWFLVHFILKWLFAELLVIDQSLRPIEALRKSCELTKGVRVDLFVFVILSLILVIAGLAALFVGFLVAMAVLQLAVIKIYRDLQSQPTNEEHHKPQHHG